MKKNWSLIVGVAIPILMIILVALSIYVPVLFAKPTTKFLYYTSDTYDYYYNDRYAVENGKLVLIPYKQRDTVEDTRFPSVKDPEVSLEIPKAVLHLFVYDPVANASQEITFEEGQKLRLESRVESPEGYTLSQGSYGGDIFDLFGGGYHDYNTWYLQKGTVNKKITLEQSASGYRYYNNIQFLGWIIQ
jgi:hypothetical protein